jgi:PKD repeat protein
LKYAAILVVIGLAIWGIQEWISGSSPKADFSYKVRDFVTLEELGDTVYYIPNNIQFTAIFNQPDSVKWDFGDSTFAVEASPIKNFTNTGDYKVKFTAFRGKKQFEKMRIISAFSPPIAEFSAPEEGCVANPQCIINFINNSSGADSFLWDFGDNTNSTEDQPQKSYDQPGDYVVSLTATNSFGKNNMYSDTVTILGRPVPFAKFTARFNNNSSPTQITFQNHSQNADRFIWQLGDNNTKVTSDPNGTFVHTYPAEGIYVVRLLAKQGDTDEDDFENTVRAKRRDFGVSTKVPSFTQIQNMSIVERKDVQKAILNNSRLRGPSN